MSQFIVAHPGAFVLHGSAEAAQAQAEKLAIGGKTYEVFRLDRVCAVKGTPYGPAIEASGAPIERPIFDRLAAEWIETHLASYPEDLDGAAAAGQMAGWIRWRLKIERAERGQSCG